MPKPPLNSKVKQLENMALLAPYLAWVTFASALTWAIWRANPQLLG